MALVVASAGCVGFAVDDASSASTTAPRQATDGQPGGATVTGQSPPVGGDGGTGSTASDAARVRSYARLYNRTIDSVVEITARTPRGRSQGSGFVYSESGYVVTNQHVVGGADSVQVRFRSGVWRTATVVGTDVYTDLAVVKVDSLPPGVDPLPVAESDPVPGQPVVALGSPFGYEGSITQGIVSGVNRSMRTTRGFVIPDTIQTDAPINPGNSGGPLVSLDGTVVGVNRAKQGDNLGFAISADVVRRVVPSIVENGSYAHSYLGVRTVEVTPRIAAANDLSAARGVMVVGFRSDGPAVEPLRQAELVRTEAGLTLPVGGDVVVSVDGRSIETKQALTRYLLLHTHPGEEVTVTVLRDGERVTETITLRERPDLSAFRSGSG